MIGTTKPLDRLAGAGFALAVALALGTRPLLAAPQVFGGCLGEAVKNYGECLGEIGGFWGGFICTAELIGDAVNCLF